MGSIKTTKLHLRIPPDVNVEAWTEDGASVLLKQHLRQFDDRDDEWYRELILDVIADES